MGIKQIMIGSRKFDKGAFTPTVVGTTTDGVGTYTAQEGLLSRTGDLVQIAINLEITSHTGVGSLKIQGIPIEWRPKQNNLLPVLSNQLTFNGQLMAFVYTDGTILLFGQSSGGNLSPVAIDSICNIYINGSYVA